MNVKVEVKKYFNKYFKSSYVNENDQEFKSLVRLLNKAIRLNKSEKLLIESKYRLTELVDKAVSEGVFEKITRSGESIVGYKKGKVLTVSELKALPKGSIVHLKYKDDSGGLREIGFVKFSGYDGGGELSTLDGFTMPIYELSDDDLILNIDNSGWSFTVSEALLKNKK